MFAQRGDTTAAIDFYRNAKRYEAKVFFAPASEEGAAILAASGRFTEALQWYEEWLSRSDAGEVSLVWGDPVTASCRVVAGAADSRQAEFARVLGADHVGYFPAGTDVRPGEGNDGLPDKVTVDGADYLVLHVDSVRDGRNVSLLVAYMRRDS